MVLKASAARVPFVARELPLHVRMWRICTYNQVVGRKLFVGAKGNHINDPYTILSLKSWLMNEILRWS
jgi:hypothetical protein